MQNVALKDINQCVHVNKDMKETQKLVALRSVVYQTASVHLNMNASTDNAVQFVSKTLVEETLSALESTIKHVSL
jgi:hypothetical protein